MAHDVARIIWNMAKADKTFDGLELKEMFLRKVEIQADELRLQLKEMVANIIRTEIQPHKSEITLTSDARVKEWSVISGGSCSTRIVNTLSPFCYFDDETYHMVTNSESIFLIERAVLPLNLKWRIKSPGINNNIIVSWRHWLT